MYRNFFKRIIDFVLALCGLIVLSPIFIILCVLIKLDSEGPVLFKQDRLGYKGKVYKMYKFRSMCVGAEKMKGGVYSNNNDFRITKIGKIIRMTSLDELPQLLNVLKGDMSLIGFRSPLTYHPWCWEDYTNEQKKMFDVRPGITGLAQINGRKKLEWGKRIELNIWYAENVTFLVDLKIIIITIFKVILNLDNENNGKTIEKEQEED